MQWDCKPHTQLLLLYLVPELQHWSGQLSRAILGEEQPPIRHFDRTLKGGFGVMFDDILAAFYALLVLAAARQLWPVVYPW